jgi:hypothetical protein
MWAELTASDWFWIAFAALGAGMFVVLLLASFILKRIQVELHEDAGFFDALRATPLIVAIFLDLLDLVLDGFGAPIAWYVLGKVGLGKLRGVAVVEALLPATQVIPTMTICWFLGKLFGRSTTQLLERAAAHSPALIR